ncbi:MAG: hypothetical protein EPO32_04665 [Anaerolineae bacterium]|nr:MAG: hypothetical protein EPO32_04665 [Anaerolineae bacterium]
MTNNSLPISKRQNFTRWAARIISLGPIIFAAGELLPGEDTIASATGLFWYDYMNLAVLYISVAGLLLAWWRPLVGGWMAIAGGLLLTLVLFPVFERMLTWGFLMILVAPGALFVASAWKPHKTGQAPAAP